jgi:SAM-dependent methyltransferase
LRILDATAGYRSIWYQKNYPNVIFMDKRAGKFYSHTPNGHKDQKRRIFVNPDVIGEWQHTPFRDNIFDMVIFDPPQIIRKEGSIPSGMAAKYGMFYTHNWRAQIEDGVRELFRVLKPEGQFILKWSDSSKSVDEVIKLIPYSPIFGTRTGRSNKTHWIIFLKQRFDSTFEEFTSREDVKLDGFSRNERCKHIWVLDGECERCGVKI